MSTVVTVLAVAAATFVVGALGALLVTGLMRHVLSDVRAWQTRRRSRREVLRLLERSSLGTPAAQALRARTPRSRRRRILQRAHQLEQEQQEAQDRDGGH